MTQERGDAGRGGGFGGLLYRYFFFSWLFRDMDAARDDRQWHAAARHNQAMRPYLAVYFVRWLVIGALLSGLGGVCERHWHAPLATAACFIAVAAIVVVLAVIAVAWLGLGRRE